MIPRPHGGTLIDRQLAPSEVARRDAELRALPRVTLDLGQSFDVAKIATGAYSPLDGFMGRMALESVVDSGRLLNGLPWPIPIYLAPAGAENALTIAELSLGDEVALLDPTGRFIAVLYLRERYPLPAREIGLGVYGTSDPQHPDIAALASTGAVALGGPIEMLRPPAVPLPQYELTPATMRELFRRKGWHGVAAFQTRNVPHLGHEHLQRQALDREDIDGLLLHPVVGPLKSGDYRPEIVLAAYESLIDHYYVRDRVALATLSIAMRYAGPRAALFLAIVRQNFGCSHYIVGRDQAGVGKFYDPYDCHRIFDQFPLEITPLRFREFAYCPRCGGMVSEKTCGHPPEQRATASQTRVRTAIAERRPLPTEILRPEVAEILRGAEVVRPAVPDATDRPAELPTDWVLPSSGQPRPLAGFRRTTFGPG